MQSPAVKPLQRHGHQAGFGRVELAFQLLEEPADRVPHVLRRQFDPADHDEVISLPDQYLSSTCT